METLLERILNILIAPPGNLIFHLVLAFSILATLQSVLISRRSSTYRYSGRLVFGLLMLLAGQLVLFLSSGLAWQGILNPHVFLPPLDRAILVFGQVWIVWLWCFYKPARLGDMVTGFLNLVVLILFLFTYTSWSVQGSELSFNNYWTDWVWELAAGIVVLTGMGILFFSRPPGWGFGFGMLSLNLMGVVAHALLTPISGDFSGLLRLSQLAAFPLLPNLLHRLALAGSAAEASAPAVSKTSASTASSATGFKQERRRYSSDPRTVQAFLQLKESQEPEKIGLAISKAIAHTLYADLCFVVTGPQFGQIMIQTGYDLIREDEIAGAYLDQKQVPLLAGALQRGKPLRITSSDSQPSDLAAIGSVLGLKEPCTLLFIPLLIAEKPWGGLLLLSAYSNRQWTQEDQNYLSSETERIALILQNAQQAPMGAAPAFNQDAEQEVEQLKRANNNLANALEETRRELEEARQAPPAAAANASEIDALVALQKEAQEIIAGLQAENEQLQNVLQEQGRSVQSTPGISTAEADHMEADLRATLKEVAYLQNQLAESNARILIFERQLSTAEEVSSPAGLSQEVLISMVQDLRQPMASIIGYTDLLLAESVGILGALQRKFLERVRASSERMHAMMEDLIQLVATGKSQMHRAAEQVELGSVIDSAVLDTSAQLREKNITLRVDLPREMPQLFGERDAIQQIVVHLLQNAGTVTPQEGSITLRARLQEEGKENYLLLQVIDTGGGIQPENLSRVFSPHFRADSPLIQGLGDTGVGLSIAKALVEAHGGRIWVESETGQTTTFSVLMPMRGNPVKAAVE